MKTEEDEAFDDLARKQGHWVGGFNAKRQAAMDKINSHFDAEYKKMHEDRAMYGTSWSKDGERIDPASVYLEKPAQEPVAWMYDWLCDGKLITGWIAHNEAEIPKLVASNIRPLYTTPPKREWVGLTDEDGCDMHREWWDGELWAEAKLKERNT